MPARVTLTVTQGKLHGQAFAFNERTTCLMGRGDDCQPQLPNDEDHRTISRHHCLLDINPPDIRIRDFGSLNGTFVNGKTIGQRAKHQTAEEGALTPFPEHDLKDGDEIELGNTVFRVGIFVPAVCAECAAEIPEEQRAAAQRAPGVYQCAACRSKTAAAQRPPDLTVRARTCAECGKDIAGEVGPNRQGQFVCAACKADPGRIVRHLLEEAQQGESELAALRGWTVERQLGRGGMGAVYLLRRAGAEDRVALKIMLPRVAADERARQMFLREAESTRALRHPNVVQLRDAGCRHGTFFFTLDYCDGGSVDRLVQQRGGPLPVAEAVDITLQALDGLDYAHNLFGPGKGLVHRDLKPQNLFLAGAGDARVVKVGDYGLSKAFDLAGLSGQTRTGTVAGTPGFVPRQQVINFKYARPEVDVWAAAASLYYLLTGAFPRDFPQSKDPWRVVLQAEAVPIRDRGVPLPDALARVIDRALTERPSIGFKTAAELRDALEAAVPGVRRARPGPPPAPTRPGPPPVPERRPAGQSGEPTFSAHAVLLRYPAPIAIPYRRFFQQKDARCRLDALFSALEAALRYLVTLGVSDLLHCLAARGGELPAHAAFDMLRRPKPMLLGSWCEALRETARALAAEDGRVVRELPETCRAGGRLDAGLLASLISKRNRGVAHPAGGIPLGPDECRALVREARPELEGVLQEVRFVCRYPLGFVQRGLGGNRYALHACTGANVRGPAEASVIETPLELEEGTPFVVSPDGSRLLSLWPLLAQRVSPLTGRHTLYVFEEIPDRKRSFLTAVRGAAVDVREDWVQVLRDEPASSHAWLLDRLRGLPASGQLPRELRLAERLLPPPGGRLAGRALGSNRLQAVLATGGMGTVYTAEDAGGRPVAVKVIEVLLTPAQAARFVQEFEQLKQAQHPGIVRCYEGGIDLVGEREVPWYAMELALGGDLRSRLDERRALAGGHAPWDDAALRAQVTEDFRAVAAAVAYLHGRDIVHRDIKPGHVLILADGELRLAGFGLIKGLDPAAAGAAGSPYTSTGAVLGTPGYMAPEQERGEEAGKAADVYALGVLLAEAAAGERVEPDNRVGAGSALGGWRPLNNLPAGLKRFLQRCTDVDPGRRSPDAGAVLAEFDRVVTAVEG